MICPKCKRPFYFLESSTPKSQAKCLKCRHHGDRVAFSYENYHTNLYSRPYQRTIQTDPQMKWILEKLSIGPDDVVIDLGCGVGDYTKAVSNLSKQVGGYDLDTAAASRKYAGIRFFKLDFDQPIPLPDASVDKIVSINVIEHLEDWNFFLRECHRVLRPGGAIALSTANRDFLMHGVHYDATHLHEWTLDEFVRITQTYFLTLHARKDCAMFNYYPLNQLLRFFLKPDLTWIGRKAL